MFLPGTGLRTRDPSSSDDRTPVRWFEHADGLDWEVDDTTVALGRGLPSNVTVPSTDARILPSPQPGIAPSLNWGGLVSEGQERNRQWRLAYDSICVTVNSPADS